MFNAKEVQGGDKPHHPAETFQTGSRPPKKKDLYGGLVRRRVAALTGPCLCFPPGATVAINTSLYNDCVITRSVAAGVIYTSSSRSCYWIPDFNQTVFNQTCAEYHWDVVHLVFIISVSL